MGLIPVGAIFKGFTFDGEDSKDYGVYISGEAVFNAPERAVDMVEIPGRSGAYALDLGRFENIEVRYPAGIAADNETDFATGISDLRNFLASRRGYCRLEDEYNPDEYRLAVYKSGLEVTPAQLKAGEFEIVFDCMPQRFLKSGETAQTITSGDTLTNPTLFPAPPLLQVWGYGGFTVNGQSLEIISGAIGEVKLTDQRRIAGNYTTTTIIFDPSALNTGDTITSLNYAAGGNASCVMWEETLTRQEGFYLVGNGGNLVTELSFNPTWSFADYPLNYGTPRSYTVSDPAATVDVYNISSGTTSTQIYSYYRQFAYDGDGTITVTHRLTKPNNSVGFNVTRATTIYSLYGVSTKSALGSPLYFDLDIGEAWKEEGGQVVSVNNAVTIPAKLPTLDPGANTITFDNTITQFKVVPRWWRV